MTITDLSQGNPMEHFNYEYFTQLAKQDDKLAMEYCNKFGGQTGEYEKSVGESKVKPLHIVTPIKIQLDHKRVAGGLYQLDEGEILSIIEQRNHNQMNIDKGLVLDEPVVNIVDDEKPEEGVKDVSLDEMKAYLKEKGIKFFPTEDKIRAKYLEANK